MAGKFELANESWNSAGGSNFRHCQIFWRVLISRWIFAWNVADGSTRVDSTAKARQFPDREPLGKKSCERNDWNLYELSDEKEHGSFFFFFFFLENYQERIVLQHFIKRFRNFFFRLKLFAPTAFLFDRITSCRFHRSSLLAVKPWDTLYIR